MKRRNAEGFTKHAQVADWYDAKFTEMGGSWMVPDEELNELLDLLVGPFSEGVAHLAGKRLIDIGCGDGKLMVQSFLRGIDTYGVDISPVALAFAREKFMEARSRLLTELANLRPSGPGGYMPVIGAFRCPMEDLTVAGDDGFVDESMDFAISYGSMEHALDIPAAVREMARVLVGEGEGKFLLYVPNEEWIHEDQPLETTMSANEWKTILSDAGLVVDLIKKVRDNNIIRGYKP